MDTTQTDLDARIRAQAVGYAESVASQSTGTLARTAMLYELSVSVATELATLYGFDTDKASREIQPVLTRYAQAITAHNATLDADADPLPVDLAKPLVTRARAAEPVLALMRAGHASHADLTTVHSHITGAKRAESVARDVRDNGPAIAADTIREEAQARRDAAQVKRDEAKRLEEADTRNLAQRAIDALLDVPNPVDSDQSLDADRLAALIEYVDAQRAEFAQAA